MCDITIAVGAMFSLYLFEAAAFIFLQPKRGYKLKIYKTRDSWKDRKEDIMFVQCEQYTFNLCISSPASDVPVWRGEGPERPRSSGRAHWMRGQREESIKSSCTLEDDVQE